MGALNVEMLRRPKVQATALVVGLSFLAWVIVCGAKQRCDSDNFDEEFDVKYTHIDHGVFFVFLMVLLWLVESILLLGYLFAHDALLALSPCGCEWNLTELIISSFVSFLMLIAACLFADGIDDAKEWYLTSHGCSLRYSWWEMGVACGFFAMFTMLAKCYVLYQSLVPAGEGYTDLGASEATTYGSGAGSGGAPATEAKGNDDEVTVSV